jgi:hypothetical protein
VNTFLKITLRIDARQLNKVEGKKAEGLGPKPKRSAQRVLETFETGKDLAIDVTYCNLNPKS